MIKSQVTLNKQIMDKDIQFAYAAGILDAEGCFSAAYDRKCNSYLPRVQVVMTDRKPLEILYGLFGGSLVATKICAGGTKIPYHFTVYGKTGRKLMESVLPYLIEKREQVEALQLLQQNIDEWNAKPRSRGNLPVDVMAYRKSLKDHVSELKAHPPEIAPARPNAKRGNLAYLTGVIEGDGCFSIIRVKGLASFRATVSVKMCCRAVLSELQTAFGGTVIAVPPRNGNCRPQFMWRVQGRAAADLCRKITPYLSFKHEEAELLRHLQNTNELWAKRAGRRGMPEHVTAIRMKWMNRIREIHGHAVAETKSEQPVQPVSDSPICTEPVGAGPAMATAA